MKIRYACLFAVILLLGACSSGAKKFPGPDDSAPVWDLNPGKWPGTNNIIREPTLPRQEASDGHLGL